MRLLGCECRKAAAANNSRGRKLTCEHFGRKREWRSTGGNYFNGWAALVPPLLSRGLQRRRELTSCLPGNHCAVTGFPIGSATQNSASGRIGGRNRPLKTATGRSEEHTSELPSPTY